MDTYSDAFILAQMQYYRANRRNGPSRDWNLIDGLRMTYENEAQRRNLL